jgi:hypothetical protein
MHAWISIYGLAFMRVKGKVEVTYGGGTSFFKNLLAAPHPEVSQTVKRASVCRGHCRYSTMYLNRRQVSTIKTPSSN